MNILHLLKSRAGAISKAGVLSLCATGGFMILGLSNYMTSSPAAQEKKVRAMADLMRENPSAVPSMNFSLGHNQFASAEEKARIEGQMADKVFGAGDQAAEAVEGLNLESNGAIGGIGKIQGSGLGAGEDSFGLNTDKGTESAGGSVRGAAQRGNTDSVDEAVAGQQKKGSKQLLKASLNTKGGSAFGGGAGSVSGANSSVGRSVDQERANRINPSARGAGSITGAMGSGTTGLIASGAKYRGMHSTSYKGNNRFSSSHGGQQMGKELNSLKKIAQDSAQIADSAGKSANEGSRAFWGNKALSEMMDVDGYQTGIDGGEIPTPEYHNQPSFDNLNEEMDKKAQFEAEHEEARGKLKSQLIALLFCTLAAALGIAAVKQSGPWGIAIAAIMMAAICAWSIAFIVQAGKYINKFGSDGISIASVIVGILCIAAVVIAFAVGDFGSQTGAAEGESSAALGTESVTGATEGAEAGAAAGAEAGATAGTGAGAGAGSNVLGMLGGGASLVGTGEQAVEGIMNSVDPNLSNDGGSSSGSGSGSSKK